MTYFAPLTPELADVPEKPPPTSLLTLNLNLLSKLTSLHRLGSLGNGNVENNPALSSLGRCNTSLFSRLSLFLALQVLLSILCSLPLSTCLQRVPTLGEWKRSGKRS